MKNGVHVRRLVTTIVVGMLLGLPLARPASSEDLRPQLDDMVAHFIEVAFGVEYATLTSRSNILAKWPGPVVGINAQGRQTPALIAQASKHVHSLAKLTGLQFRTLKPGEIIPSIDLVFMKRAHMGNISGPNIDPAIVRSMASDPTMVCYFLAWRSPPQTIIKAMVVVNVETDPTRIDACLLEELTQVMGLPNDVAAYWPSIFNPNDTSTSHSQWDELYIKTLYDPRLKPGMNPTQAAAQARVIFAEALSKTP